MLSGLHRKSQLGSFLSEAPSATGLDEAHHSPVLTTRSPRLQRGHRELQSFLGSLTDAAERVTAQRCQHEDFLFGSPDAKLSASASAPSLRPKPFELPMPQLSMGPAFAAAGTALAAPFQATASACEAIGKQVSKLEPFYDQSKEELEQTGWCRFVPRVLSISFWYDALAVVVLGHALAFTCDVPLRSWLLGGIALSFPVSSYIDRFVSTNTQRFDQYRLTVTELRGGGNPENFKMEELVIYSRLGGRIHRSYLEKRTEKNYWFTNIREYTDLVVGYQVVTHRFDSPATDPKSWKLEGSDDGRNWTLIDECEGEDLPDARGAESVKYEDLYHIPDAVAGFRQGFLLEVAACAVSFGWLVLGTSWVSAGTESCVDSAPLLWYWAYFGVVVTWSFVGTITIGLIVSAVVMVILGATGGAKSSSSSS